MLQLCASALQLLFKVRILLLGFGQLALQTLYLLLKAADGLLKLLGVSDLDGDVNRLCDSDGQCNLLRTYTNNILFEPL